MKSIIFCLFGLFFSLLLSKPALSQQRSYDLIVYGGTASGVMTAVAASREHLRVAIIEPGDHVGGMLTSGLSGTDVANPDVIGGLAREFFDRMGAHYHAERFGHSTAWNFEPYVGEAVLRQMLVEAKVDVFYNERLNEQGAVDKQHGHIISIRTDDNEAWKASVFADCSYEGDLMAQAEVAFTIGREGTDKYGEELAGVRTETPMNQLPDYVSAYGPDGKLLPQISPVPLAKAGTADDKVQAFNFRLILSRNRSNQLPFDKPGNYRASDYALLHRALLQLSKEKGRNLRLADALRIVPIPNEKADFNNIGGFSTDYLNESWVYLTESYARRAQIFQQHIAYTKGLMYFLAHDPGVPTSIRSELNLWGYAKDEFKNSGQWPFQLYIREGRRMTSDFVLTQKDLQTSRTKRDTIGLGSHNIDSHNVQRIVTSNGFALNEGDVQEHVQPYALPYSILVPKQSEASNLLVPICVSASHVAYSSLRMEPQYMILGQAAGIAAAVAVQNRTTVQAVNIEVLQNKLKAADAILSYPITTNYIVQ